MANQYSESRLGPFGPVIFWLLFALVVAGLMYGIKVGVEKIDRYHERTQDSIVLTKIDCELHGQRFEFIRGEETWHRPGGYNVIVIDTPEGETSFPASACITTKLKSVEITPTE